MSKYFLIGMVLLAAGATSAVLLNVQGASCLSQLARLDRSTMPAGAADLERDCFIVTNSYVYSLFAAVIGAAVLAYWYWKKRQ
ncbi:MAG: hypothetical protein ACREAY_04090 [Nitrososphaera sp.]|uniref:hypothetical protein n=1 Tax=Nitrososphaera sp. TaxID=1971748 RepID=UPI003D6E4BDE